MLKLGKKVKKTWFITKQTDASIVHYGFVDNRTEMASGLDEMETFTTKKAYTERLLKLGIITKNKLENDVKN